MGLQKPSPLVPGRWVHDRGWIGSTSAAAARHVEVYPFALMDARTASEKDLCVFEMLGSKRCKLIVTLVTIIQAGVITLGLTLESDFFFHIDFVAKGPFLLLLQPPKGTFGV